jgi:hypothetical protein
MKQFGVYPPSPRERRGEKEANRGVIIPSPKSSSTIQPSLTEAFVKETNVDWALAIRRNRDQLRQIVLALFALARMRVGGSLFCLQRDVFSAIMLVLRPAESAVRRLIVIAAHGLVLKPPPPREALMVSLSNHEGFPPTRAFKLFDPLKSFDQEDFWVEAQRQHDHALRQLDPASGFTIIDTTPVDATHISQRLNALMRALDNLPHQARRLIRWQSKRDAALKAHRPTRLSPIRPGLPPGWRERKIHEIDDVLKECHGLANDLLNVPNTS